MLWEERASSCTSWGGPSGAEIRSPIHILYTAHCIHYPTPDLNSFKNNTKHNSAEANFKTWVSIWLFYQMWWCFYRWLLRVRRVLYKGWVAETGDKGTGSSFAEGVQPKPIDCSVTFTTEAANWKVLLLVWGQRVFNNATEPMVLMSLGC